MRWCFSSGHPLLLSDSGQLSGQRFLGPADVVFLFHVVGFRRPVGASGNCLSPFRWICMGGFVKVFTGSSQHHHPGSRYRRHGHMQCTGSLPNRTILLVYVIPWTISIRRIGCFRSNYLGSEDDDPAGD
jgi:hypothetical protein